MLKLHCILLSIFVCHVSASLNHLAFQTVVAPKVYRCVTQECPNLLFKVQHLKGQIKQKRKELANNGIKDLTKFEAGLDEGTLERYCAWACSSDSPKYITNFPTIDSLTNLVGFEGSSINNNELQGGLIEENDTLSQMEADTYPADKKTCSYANNFYLGVFLFGLILGSFAMQCYHLHFIGEKFMNKGLRRPEL